MNQPLIITLRLNESSLNFFDGLRKKYFPPDVNFLTAHLTLFHHLPSNESSIKEDLLNWSMNHHTIILQVSAIKSIGKGVAYKIESEQLLQLHCKMQKQWKQWLTNQDKQKLWPHITVQNKVSPQQANATLSLLEKDFTPFVATGIGFDLWSYENGPWNFIEHYHFAQRH